MTVEKNAQYYNVDGDLPDEDDVSYSYDYEVVMSDDEEFNAKDKSESKSDKKDEDKENDKDDEDDDEDISESESKSDHDDVGGELVVLEFDEPEETVSFTVPELPGAMDLSDIPEPEELTVEEEEREVDPWDWKANGGHSNFLHWLNNMVNSTPRHSGHDVAGLERAMSYIQLLLKEVSKAMRTDYRGEIDVAHCENMADGMYSALDRMNDRANRLRQYKYPNHYKKKASWIEDSGLVKEGQKVTGVSGVTLVVPLFISRLARVLINGTVSGGHSMEDMYDDLKEKYDLTMREEAELQQLLNDMGYPMYQDRGMLNEQVDKSRSDNKDWAANYNG